MFVKRMAWTMHDENLEVGGLWHETRAKIGTEWLELVDEYGKPRAGGPLEPIYEHCVQSGHDVINRASKIVPGIAGIVKALYECWLPLRGPGAPGDDLPTLYGVEVLFEVTEPIRYSARIDQWHWDDGPIIKEIKTAARRDTTLIDSYRMDPQFIGHRYLWRRCMKRQYGDLKSYHVDLITKTSDPYIGPETVVMHDHQLRDWLKEMKWLNLQLVQCEMTGIWPRLKTWRCRRGNRPCLLYDHCASNGKYNVGWRKKSKSEY
jgi:hypothetical protein